MNLPPAGPAAALCAAAYLVGAIPFGVIVARLKGVDLRAHGSGNIGATNVGRVLGRAWGLLVFALDAGKCVGVMAAARFAAARCTTGYPSEPAAWLLLGAGLCAIAGNVAPIYLRFRGGKAVAASAGVLLGVWPDLALPALGCAAIWLLAVQLTRYVSVASLLAATAHPLLTLGYLSWSDRPIGPVYPVVLLSGLLTLVIIIRHRANIARLLAGTEQRVGAASSRSA